MGSCNGRLQVNELNALAWRVFPGEVREKCCIKESAIQLALGLVSPFRENHRRRERRHKWALR